ncbi:MAG: cupin domain-containing protein [Nanoarchaeota archaeon]|nr:cupin domain-containing protein [Nanoarchaeota archaeon]
MKIEKLNPDCNLNTIKDGRGGIFTFIPKDPIVEFNHLYIKAAKIRGNHFHPEFDEYLLIVSGSGVIVTKDSPDSKEEFIYLSRGDCVYTPKNTPHVFYAITDCEAVAMLTKKWDDCNPPIVHENLGMGTGDHGDPNYKPLK